MQDVSLPSGRMVVV